jgi:hypothetical protein
MKAKEKYLELTGFRLPTEAEWEYACRAGTVTSRHYGQSDSFLPRYAHYNMNSERHLSPVGRLKPNGFGIFDMLGNAVEWCHDGVYEYGDSHADKSVPENLDALPVFNTGARMVRGGSYVDMAFGVRAAHRTWDGPSALSYGIGFRVARTIR